MKNLCEYKHLFFDLDDTLTQSKSPIEKEMKDVLARSGKDIIVVSGAEIGRIAVQTDNFPAYYLGQNGNDAVDNTGKRLWQDFLTPQEKAAILRHNSQLISLADWYIQNPADLVDDRGCQISLSTIGHHEDIVRKKTFDPHSHVRLAMLEQYPFVSDIVEVKIGGTTTFDYFRKGAHKGANVARLIAALGWNKDACVYFGDKLHSGGNDETVVGVIDTIPVDSHEHTLALLQEAFGKT